MTAGLGYDVSKNLDLSVACAYRSGSTTITAEDVKGAQSCPFCGQPGEYGLNLFGAYIDVRWRFGGSSAQAAAPTPAAPSPVPAAPEAVPVAPEALPVAPAPAPVAPSAPDTPPAPATPGR